MVQVGNVEKRIQDIEGFDVIIRHEDGRDMRSDREDLRQYEYQKRANNAWTVAQWKSNRFRQQYPGLDADVLDGAGHEVHYGQTLLSTVRASYS